MKPHRTAQKNKKKQNGVLAGQESVALALEDLLENGGGFPVTDEETCPFFTTDEDVLLWCVDMLSFSPSAFAHLRHAARGDWSIGLSDLGGSGFSLDTREKVILIDRNGMEPAALSRSSFFRTNVMFSFIRALRDLWQEARMEGAERVYAPESFLILSRLRAADMDVFALLCAWELRQAGHGIVWRHMIGSPEGDMALAFGRKTERSGAAELFSTDALAAAFLQWFGEEDRMKSADHDSLEFLDDVLRGAGRNSPFGKGRIGSELIESLSLLPDGTRYLTGRGGAILSDPTFHDMQDEVNQAHLLHIMHDLDVIRVGNVPFRDAGLAYRIFPDTAVRGTTV